MIKNLIPTSPQKLNPEPIPMSLKPLSLQAQDQYLANQELPIVSIVVPLGWLPSRTLNVEVVKPKKGTTMETTGMDERVFQESSYMSWFRQP